MYVRHLIVIICGKYIYNNITLTTFYSVEQTIFENLHRLEVTYNLQAIHMLQN